ncbi:CopD family protein [Streptomyces sp. NBC_01497]|uniref:CopD family protein n=1 Tax=Streptomyces sp. NBC_01497 TaxID=2903885 RepID=UPI002E369EFF|nr:CopD family protein [Streptomyces sp. NBC_01497]
MSFPGPPAQAADLPDARRGPARTAGRVAVGTTGCVLIALLGVAAATHGTGELPLPAAGTTTLLHAVVFAALAVHLGEFTGTRVARAAAKAPVSGDPAQDPDAPAGAGPVPAARVAGRDRPAPRALAAVASLAGAGASAGQLVLLSAVSGMDLAAVYGTADGRLLLVMTAGFLLAAGCAALSRRGWAPAPLAAVVCAEAVRAHPEQFSPFAGSALTAVHLTAAALWSGGLLYGVRLLWSARGDRPYTRAVLARQSRHTGWLIAALAATGTLCVLRKLPFEVALTSAYGRVLLLKLVLVGAAGACALGARRRLRGEAGAGSAVYAQLAVLLGVVLVSAVLTVVPDPHWLALERR